MKRQLLSFLAALGLLMVAESAFAQDMHVSANIPFSFTVDKVTLPAGQYDIRAIGSHGSDVLAINNRSNNMGRMILTRPLSTGPGHSSSKTELVFRRYGEQYLLSQIWVESSDTGRELPTGVRETEVASGYAPARVIVAADSR